MVLVTYHVDESFSFGGSDYVVGTQVGTVSDFLT